MSAISAAVKQCPMNFCEMRLVAQSTFTLERAREYNYLFSAAEGDLAEVQRTIAAGVDISAIDRDSEWSETPMPIRGRNVVFYVCIHGKNVEQIEAVVQYIFTQAKLKGMLQNLVNARDFFEMAPVHFALNSRVISLKCLQAFIHAGAQLAAVSKAGRNALHELFYGYWNEAVGDLEVSKLKYAVDTVALPYRTALHNEVYGVFVALPQIPSLFSQSSAATAGLISEYVGSCCPWFVNAADENGDTPLHVLYRRYVFIDPRYVQLKKACEDSARIMQQAGGDCDLTYYADRYSAAVLTGLQRTHLGMDLGLRVTVLDGSASAAATASCKRQKTGQAKSPTAADA